MATSRLCGGTVFMTSSSKNRLPSVTSSSPAIMFSVVDLPQPEGPEQHQELLVGDVEVQVLQRDEAVGIFLADGFESDAVPCAPLTP